jgi:integrase
MKIAKEVDPSSTVVNRAPPPRSQRWAEGETARFVKGAIRNGYLGLACIVAVAWDSSFSPADVRGLRKRHIKELKTGTIFDLSVDGRKKTGRPAIGTISKRTQALVEAYLAATGCELHDEAFLFRTRSGAPYRDSTLSHDFAAVRKLLFPGESRLLMDMRRSGAVEAVAGEAKPTTLSAKLANSIEHSNALHKVYDAFVSRNNRGPTLNLSFHQIRNGRIIGIYGCSKATDTPGVARRRQPH